MLILWQCQSRDITLAANILNGLIQIISLLPTSYPGHSIITEDQGAIFGEDDCKCGRSGKYFKVFGRIPKSEIRGCGNIDDY